MNTDTARNISAGCGSPILPDDCLDHTGARELTCRFFEGMTDLYQEQQLYAYYARRDVAADLAANAPLMRWLAEGCPLLEYPVAKPGSWCRLARLAAAVVITVLVGSSVFTMLDARSDLNDARRCYGGSYLMADGRRVTDLTEVLVSMEMASDQIDDMLIDCNFIQAQ